MVPYLKIDKNGLPGFCEQTFRSKLLSKVETWHKEVLGTGKFVCYISSKKKLISFGPVKLVSYIWYFDIWDLFISSFHVNNSTYTGFLKVKKFHFLYIYVYMFYGQLSFLFLSFSFYIWVLLFFSFFFLQ